MPGAHGVPDPVADHFQILTAVLINKVDLSTAQSGAIADLCDQLGVPVVGYLPHDPTVTDAMVHGEPITMHDGPVTDQLTKVWNELKAPFRFPLIERSVGFGACVFLELMYCKEVHLFIPRRIL